MTSKHDRVTARDRAQHVHIGPAEFEVSDRDDVLFSTVLGSCIAVCMRDPRIGVGGINHFVLPSPSTSERIDENLSLRYGAYSIERLINALISRGGNRLRLETKVFGGANVLSFASGIGSRNSDFVERYLAEEGLPIAAKSLRGTRPRRLLYSPSTGQAWIKYLETLRGDAAEVERAAIQQPAMPQGAGRVVLFD